MLVLRCARGFIRLIAEQQRQLGHEDRTLALKVLAVELTEDAPDVELSQAEDGVFCLVTRLGRPIGDLIVRSTGSKVRAADLREEIARKLGRDALTRRPSSWPSESRYDGVDSSPCIYDPAEPRPLVSVVVCTRDRPADLVCCLASLRNIKYRPVEILVVDNASSDGDTRRVALESGARYVREDTPGLDIARNRGIRESTGDLVAFTDDDVVVDPGWVDGLLSGFADESIACVTGLVMPVELASEAQIIFESYGNGGFRRGYCARVFDRQRLPPAAAGKVGAGANMAFRRQVFDHVGCFDEALDCGTPARAGGDFDMFYRLLAAGYRICYQPAALVWHRHRSTMEELERQLHGYGIAVYAVLTKSLWERRDWRAVRFAFGYFFRHLVYQTAKAAFRRTPVPFSLAAKELLGSFQGPFAYFAGKAYASRIKTAEASGRGE